MMTMQEAGLALRLRRIIKVLLFPIKKHL